MAFSLLDTPAELRREPAFLLYTTDFSRIQRFIYTVHTEGALRSLRSRSFFLELLMEHYTDELLDGCGLTRTNIIYSGGGHCYLLLPNTATVQQTLADWNRAFNGWLNEQFGVQLFLANGWTLRRHRDQNHPWHGRRIGGAAGSAAEVSVSAGAHTFSMFFPQGDESALVIPPTFPIFDCPGTVLPARGQQKRRPCRNADLHRAALLFPEHQTTIFP